MKEIGGLSEQHLLGMAKVVASGAFGSSLQMGGGSKALPKAKRKTPTELRVSLLPSFHCAVFFARLVASYL